MAYTGDPVPTTNEGRAAVKAEEWADAQILKLAEADAEECAAEQAALAFERNVENALDYFRSDFWDGFYKEAYDETLAELEAADAKALAENEEADKRLAELKALEETS